MPPMLPPSAPLPPTHRSVQPLFGRRRFLLSSHLPGGGGEAERGEAERGEAGPAGVGRGEAERGEAERGEAEPAGVGRGEAGPGGVG